MYGNGWRFSLALFVCSVSTLQAAVLNPQETPGTMVVPQAGLSSVPIRLIHRPANPFPDAGRDLPGNRRALHAKESETAYAAAWELGRQEDVLGLREILRLESPVRRRALFILYSRALAEGREDRPLPSELEALILEYRDRPGLFGELIKLAALRPYRSRALFDHLYQERRMQVPVLWTPDYKALIALLKRMEKRGAVEPDLDKPLRLSGYGLREQAEMQPRYKNGFPLLNARIEGIEAALARLLPELDAEARNRVRGYLLKKSYPPMIAELEARLKQMAICDTDRIALYKDLRFLSPEIIARVADDELRRYWANAGKTVDSGCVQRVLQLARQYSRFQGSDDLYCGHFAELDSRQAKRAYLGLGAQVPRQACLEDVIQALLDPEFLVRQRALENLKHYQRLEDMARVLVAYLKDISIKGYRRPPVSQQLDAELRPWLSRPAGEISELLDRLNGDDTEAALASAWILGKGDMAAGLQAILDLGDEKRQEYCLAMFIDGNRAYRDEALFSQHEGLPDLPMDPGIEQIVVENLGGPLETFLVHLTTRRRYESPELLAYFQDRRDVEQLLLSRHADANAVLLELLPELDARSRERAIEVLLKRDYAPVREYIQSESSPDSPSIMAQGTSRGVRATADWQAPLHTRIAQANSESELRRIILQIEKEIARIRFIDGEPERAASRYHVLLAALPEKAFAERIWAEYLLGDLYQYDLKDNARAAKAYSHVLEQFAALEAAGDSMSLWATWLAAWLPHEIHFLKTGVPLSRDLGVTEFAECGTLIYLGLEPPLKDHSVVKALQNLDRKSRALVPVDRAAYRQLLDRLPRSHLFFMTVAQRFPLIRDPDHVLDLLEKQDPGRFWSSCFLGVVKRKPEFMAAMPSGEEWEDLEAVLQGFQARTGLSLELLREYPLASPQEAWMVMNKALLLGETEIARECLTGKARDGLGERIQGMNQDQGRSFAHRWRDLQDLQEQGDKAWARVEDKSGNRFRVEFRRMDARWRISALVFLPYTHSLEN